MRLLLLLPLLAACTVLNRPDPPTDAGTDTLTDTRIDTEIDAPPDVPDPDMESCIVGSGDEDEDGRHDCADVEDCEGESCSTTAGACVCRNGRAVELDCGNRRDDDGDGTTDCGDFDCAGLNLAECCGEETTPSHWPSFVCPIAGWTERGGTVVCSGSTLTEFFATEPFGMVWDDCLSLALGASFSIDFTPTGDTSTCDGSGRCVEHVKLLIAERNQPRESDGRFFAELAVAMYPSGRVEVLQGDTPVESGSVMVEVDMLSRVQIDFRPTTSESGEAELHATVSYGATSTFLWEGFVVRLEDLITDGQCTNVPGFYMVLEGLGNGVEISALEPTQSECSNPNLFQPSADYVLTPYEYGEFGTASLELDPPRLLTSPRLAEASWATQALSSPTLMRRGTTGRWLVAAEASNDQPANEPSFRVGYAIGYRETTTWNDDALGWTDGGSDRPWVGNQPPSCLDETCSGEFTPEMPPFPSVRDPFLFASGGVESLAFAGEVDDDGDPARTERFGIYIANQSSLGDGTLPSATVLAPGQVTGCDSLRDPVVVRRPGAEATDFWLFFTCYEALSSRGIWVVPITSQGGFSVLRVEGGAIVEPTPVLTTIDLDFGRGGTLRSPEIVLDTIGDDERAVFAVWFLVGQEVGLAIGGPKSPYAPATRASTSDAPSLQLFEGNPVLTPEDRAFNRTCAGCSIEGLAVFRTDDTTLRFLIARENDDTPARYDLLPLEQTWRNLAAP